MKFSSIFSWALMAAAISATEIAAAQSVSPQGVIASQPVYVPNMSHASGHLPGTMLRWDATMKTTNVPAGTMSASLVFHFTNVDRFPLVVTDARGSCSCTTVQLPAQPWTLPPGTNGQIGVTVNLAGKFGIIVKTAHIWTDQGACDLIVQIVILPPPQVKLTDAEIARQMAIARVDRQAVFKNDCATCHVQPGQFKYGKELFDTDCGICHQAEHRASMVPDLHNLKVPTNEEFWRIWIAQGKPGSFMPAFSTANGGPLSDMQIASLSAYLNAAIPSKVPSLQ